MNPLSEFDDDAVADEAGTDVRFYGRRKGKALKAGRLALLETLLPRLRVVAAPTPRAFDPRTLFASDIDAVWLEIGFGGGEHLAAQAEHYPKIGFIGSEVFLNGVASLLRHVEERRLSNVRVLDSDVRALLPTLPDACLERISLLFPDPWPKTRHAKRRFVSISMLDELARLLKDNSELRIYSDHPVYVRWALQHGTDHPAFRWAAKCPDDWRIRPDDSTASRYEKKAIAAGRTPTFMRFFRVPRAA